MKSAKRTVLIYCIISLVILSAAGGVLYRVYHKDWDYFNVHDAPGISKNESEEIREIFDKLRIDIYRNAQEHSGKGGKRSGSDTKSRSGGSNPRGSAQNKGEGRMDEIIGSDYRTARKLTHDEYRRVIAEINTRLEKDPDNKRLISKKIHLAFRHDPDEAIRECKKILAEDENNFFALNHCATGYMLKKDFDKAFYYAGRAQQVGGDSAYIQTLIAGIHLYNNDMESALYHFDKALDYDPDFEKALYGCRLVAEREAIGK